MKQGCDYELQHTRTTILMLSDTLAMQEPHGLFLTGLKHCLQGNRQHLVAMPTTDILLYAIKGNSHRETDSPGEAIMSNAT